MKISNSKKELARIISENGGWSDGAEFAAQDKDGGVFKFDSKPVMGVSRKVWMPTCNGRADKLCYYTTIKGWHQTILSRAEYFHLYPATDADGWIEWNGGECPVGEGDLIDVKLSDGDEFFDVGSDWDWGVDAGSCNIIAYRLHKQSEPEFCESMMRSIPEPSDKPTIEQLAADYRNAKDYSERKQQEADDAKAEADAGLKALELAGEAIGLIVQPITEKKEPELVITDWRDLQVGDVVKITSVFERGNEDYCDAIGTDAVVIYAGDPARQDLVVSQGDMKLHIDGFRFIRRHNNKVIANGKVQC